MKNNMTTWLLVALAAFLGWKYALPMLQGNAKQAPTQLPAGGATNTNQPDVVGSIIGALDGIFRAAGAIAQTSQKTN